MTKSRIQILFLLTLPLLYIFISVYTYVGTFWFDWAKNTPFNFYDKISESTIQEACMVFGIGAISYIFGWFIASKFVVSKAYNQYQEFQSKITVLTKRHRLLILGLNIFVILLFIFGYGFSSLIERPGYAQFDIERNKFLLKIHLILLPISIFTLAFLKLKYLKFIVFSFHFVLLFSASTRLLGLIFFIYGLGVFAKSSNVIKSGVLLYFLAGLYFFIWILSMRGYSPQGFLYNFEYLFFANTAFEAMSVGINYITSFSVYGLAYSIENKAPDLYSFLVSISPLPLSFHDGERMLESQRLLGTSPMSVVAIIYSFGLAFFFCFYAFIGVTAYFISLKLKNNKFLSLAVVGVFMIAVFLSVQYNLRGFSRLLYLAVFLSLFSYLFYKAKLNMGHKLS